MKTIVVLTILVTLSLSAFSPTAVSAQASYSDAVKAPTSATGTAAQATKVMAKEPNYVLVMAYQDGVLAFADALNGQTVGGGPVNVDFARAAVVEMRRGFDQMKKYNEAYMKTISAEVRAKSTATMQGLETHRADLNVQLTSLEAEVKLDTPDAKKIATLSASVRTHLDAMSLGSTGLSMKN